MKYLLKKKIFVVNIIYDICPIRKFRKINKLFTLIYIIYKIFGKLLKKNSVLGYSRRRIFKCLIIKIKMLLISKRILPG